MEPFELAQSFVESSLSAVTPRVLATAFERAVQHLGFRYFACCSHVDPLVPRGAVMLHNYPDDWIRVFSERRLHQIDPVLLHAERSLLPFLWDSPDFRARITAPQRKILAEAATHGLDRGCTIPIHTPSRALRASCSVVPDSDSIDKRSYLAVHLMSIHLYHSACRQYMRTPIATSQNVLSERERQCLELVAHGKDDWTIGRLLCISDHTVHRHIERAKRRLGVATRIQAVAYALHTRQISFGDVIRADLAPELSHDAESAPRADLDAP
jgi:DNA-binding CsgD family transcriptional regulator